MSNKGLLYGLIAFVVLLIVGVVGFVAYLVYKALGKLDNTVNNALCEEKSTRCGADKAKCDADNAVANIPLVGGLLKKKRDCTQEFNTCMGNCAGSTTPATTPVTTPATTPEDSNYVITCPPGQKGVYTNVSGKPQWVCVTCTPVVCNQGYHRVGDYCNGTCEKDITPTTPTGTYAGGDATTSCPNGVLDMDTQGTRIYSETYRYATGADPATPYDLVKFHMLRGSCVKFGGYTYKNMSMVEFDVKLRTSWGAWSRSQTNGGLTWNPVDGADMRIRLLKEQFGL